MIRVEEAVKIIRSVSIKLQTTSVPVIESVGRVLAEEVIADRDFPPFNRVAMDGIAVRSKNFSTQNRYTIEDIQPAGIPQKRLQNQNNCIEVMTGAVLPEGTDAVIRYEDTIIKDGSASITLADVKPGSNIHAQGIDARKGDCLLEPGQLLSPAEVSLMASVGRVQINVFDFPKAAMLSTGDELVDISDAPGPHQVRRSNVYALQSAMHEMSWSSDSFHLPDNKAGIKEKLEVILQTYRVILLSGGVSRGKFDFIAEALIELGVKKEFHQVSQKPGKPFWFGTSADHNIVFALPGNPVSTFLCFYKYIKPWMYQNAGVKLPHQSAILVSDVKFPQQLTYFLQVNVLHEQGCIKAYPVPGGGSGDFVNLKKADGFLELPLQQSEFKAGEAFTFIPFR